MFSELLTDTINSSNSSHYILTNNIEPNLEKEYARDISPISTLQTGAPIEFQIPGTSIFLYFIKRMLF
ncbi:MAG: hypothetical protein FD143_3200 [Ignavibacteria bacterium]|nr:MAG: hypothetical protein FD143_3200 [Ignavibacteria bacterium]